MTGSEGIIENANAGADLILRRALFGGVFACLGAAVGWLLWLALQKWPEVLIAPAIGVAIELVRQGFKHYKKLPFSGPATAAVGEAPPGAPEESPAFRIGWSAVRRASLLLLAVALGVMADLIKENFLQFVQSLAVFFPVGAVFAVLFSREVVQTDNLFERLPYGVVAGIAATMASLLIFFAMGGVDAIANIYSGWWVLVGICFAAAHVDRTDSHTGFFLAPLGGILILLFAILILVSFNLDGLAGGVFKVIPASVNSLLTGPDLPATSWTAPPESNAGKKDQQGAEDKPSEMDTPTTPAEPNWISSMLDCTGLPPLNITPERIKDDCDSGREFRVYGSKSTCMVPACDRLDLDCPPSVMMGIGRDRPTAFDLVNRDRDSSLLKPNEKRDTCLQRMRDCDAGSKELAESLNANPYSDGYLIREAMDAELTKEPHTFRRRMLCKQMQMGLGSGLARSLLAVIFFSVFWGWSKSVEQNTRPDNYEGSRIQRIDRVVLLGVAVFIVAVIVLSRWNSAG